MAKTQTLSFPIRLPESKQADALRLLDASREATNQMITDLWSQLDQFAEERSGPAWKQVDRLLILHNGHGSRQERCEMEQAGRLLRAQATRKQVFQTIFPLLSQALIKPIEGKRPAHKDHRLIKEQVRALRAQMKADGDEGERFVSMTNLIEQACNHYLREETFPQTYEEMQEPPVLTVGQLTFAGDDGMRAGQTYRARLDVAHFSNVATRQETHFAHLFLRLRTPHASGSGWGWGVWSPAIVLPEVAYDALAQGAVPQAPTLREIRSDDGSRTAVFDVILEVPARLLPPLEEESRVLGFDWGVRLRREVA